MCMGHIVKAGPDRMGKVSGVKPLSWAGKGAVCSCRCKGASVYALLRLFMSQERKARQDDLVEEEKQ